MRSLVVLFALAAVASASLAPVLQYHAPLVAVAPAHTTYVGGSAVSHQSRVDVHSSPAVVSTYAAPAVLGYSAYNLGYGYGHGYGHGHWLKKRSLGHVAYSAPLVVAPSAVSHQSRVDVISKPAIYSHAVAAPVVAHHAVAAPVVAVAPAAVSHQSRVDVRASYTPYAHSVAYAAPYSHGLSYAAPYAHGLSYATPYAHGLSYAAPHYGHLLKKRSLAYAHALPSAVSHQSRVDVISEPAVVAHAYAAPVVSHHVAAPVVAVAPAAVSHQSRVDVISEPAHYAHSTVYAAPAHYAHGWHSPLAYSSHW